MKQNKLSFIFYYQLYFGYTPKGSIIDQLQLTN